MKATLRYFMLLAVCIIPFTFMKDGSIVERERFPIVLGITLAVTIAYWVGYVIIEKKRKKQNEEE